MDESEGLEDLIEEVTEVVEDDAEPQDEDHADESADEEDSEESEEEEDGEPEEDSEQTPLETLEQVAAALEIEPDGLMDNVKGTVVVNGESQEVTLREALRGYQRQLDYDQGRTELRQERDAHLNTVAQHQQSAQQELLKVGQFMQSIRDVVLEQAKSPEVKQWEVSQDPSDQLKLVRYHQMQNERMQAIAQLEQQAANDWQTRQQEMLQMQSAQQQQFLAEQQQSLQQKVPDWTNDKGREMAEYLVGSGFTPEEVEGVVDHRMVMIALKAQAYDQQQKATETVQKKVAKLPKPSKPGKPVSKEKAKRGQVGRRAARARQTGKVEDAARAIEHLIQ